MEKEYPGPVSQPTLLQQAQRAEEQWGLLYSLLVQSDSECVSECDSSSGSAMHTQTSWRVIPLTPSHTHSHRSTRECESRIIYGSFWEFSQWMSGVESSCYHSFTVNSASERVTECFHSIPSHACRSVAVYADYKYFHELFCGEKRLVSERQALWLLPHHHSLTASHHHSLTASSNTALSDHSHTHSLTASTSPVLLMDWGLPRVAACKDKYSSLVPQEMGPEASTLWLGTRGAHTPLHYDSYGSNVVLQVHGCKTWHFWAPTDDNRKRLHPLRIPFEESSVYSHYDPMPYHLHDCAEGCSCATCCNMLKPDITIVLEAGDVLLVPKHWWHFVFTESEVAMSVNMWVPCNEMVNDVKPDVHDSATEAVGRFIFGALKRGVDSMQWEHGASEEVTTKHGWLNPVVASVPQHDDNRKCGDSEGKNYNADHDCHDIEIIDDPPITDMNMNFELLKEALSRLELNLGNHTQRQGFVLSEDESKRKMMQRLTSAILHPDVLSLCVSHLMENTDDDCNMTM